MYLGTSNVMGETKIVMAFCLCLRDVDLSSLVLLSSTKIKHKTDLNFVIIFSWTNLFN
jgi:hypothetical protein